MEHLPMVVRRERSSTAVMAPAARRALEAKRETILSLPAWATWRAGWLGTVRIDGRATYYLTTGLKPLDARERHELESHVIELEEITKPGAGDDETKLALVAKMLMTLASAALSELGTEAKGEAYGLALADLPTWAVNIAINAWYAGTVKGIKPSEFKWEPGSAMLARIAREIVAPYEAAAEKARRLLGAKPLDEVLR